MRGFLDFRFLNQHMSENPALKIGARPDYNAASWFLRGKSGKILKYLDWQTIEKLELRIGDELEIRRGQIVSCPPPASERPDFEDWIDQDAVTDPTVPFWLDNPNIQVGQPEFLDIIRALSRIMVRFGYGQKCLIAATPKTGKSWIAMAIRDMVLADRLLPHHQIRSFVISVHHNERSEEVNRFRHPDVETWSTRANQDPEERVHLAFLAFERAKRLVELGFPVVMFFDSFTRLIRDLNEVHKKYNPDDSPGTGAVYGAIINTIKQLYSYSNCFNGGTQSFTLIGTMLNHTKDAGDTKFVEETESAVNSVIYVQGIVKDNSRKPNLTKVGYPAINIPESETRYTSSMAHHPIYAVGEHDAFQMYQWAMSYRRILATSEAEQNGRIVKEAEEVALDRLLVDMAAYPDSLTLFQCAVVETGIDLSFLQRAFNHVADTMDQRDAERYWGWQLGRMFSTAKQRGQLETVVQLFLDKVLRGTQTSRQLEDLLDIIQPWFERDAVPAVEAREQNELN